MTDGPILEMGGGVYSTALLHWACYPHKRELVTYDNSPKWYHVELRHYITDFHQVHLIEDWDTVPIERPWDIAFIDHAPAERRKIDVARLANYANYVVIHDSEGRRNRQYGYTDIYPLFKYQFHFREIRPHTSILSNFIDLKDFKL